MKLYFVVAPDIWHTLSYCLQRVLAIMLAGVALVAPACKAQSLSPLGCPVFHCTVEATGVMGQALVETAALKVNLNDGLGQMKFQGCSGNGAQLACLFAKDYATGSAKGTLKLIDATTLLPYWGSAGSYDLDAASASGGQVPVMFANGQLAAGDHSVHALYDASGALISKVRLKGSGNNYGLTPLSDDLGVVSQSDGVLTLINMTTWQAVGTPLLLRDKTSHVRLHLVSPSSANDGVLYAVAINPNVPKYTPGSGYLLSVVVNSTGTGLTVRSQFAYDGATGASAVVINKAISGLSADLVLLQVPGLNGDNTNHLLGLQDAPKGRTYQFQPMWTIDLTQELVVAPTIDAGSQMLFFVYKNDPHVYQYSFVSGLVGGGPFDIGALGGSPTGFVINGHLGASQNGSTFTILLSGAIAKPSRQAGQYMIAFRPIANPNALLWAQQTNTRADSFTAAWNLAPSSQPDVYCAVVVGSANGLTRVCDF